MKDQIEQQIDKLVENEPEQLVPISIGHKVYEVPEIMFHQLEASFGVNRINLIKKIKELYEPKLVLFGVFSPLPR